MNELALLNVVLICSRLTMPGAFRGRLQSLQADSPEFSSQIQRVSLFRLPLDYLITFV